MYLAVDMGGTKTLLAAFSLTGEVLEQYKFPTPETYEQFLVELEKAFKNLKQQEFVRCAYAVPGKVDRKNGYAIAFGNRPWTDLPIEVDVEKIVKCPVILENDANLAGLSEALLIKDTYRKVLYVTISTGIGGGLVIDGQLAPDFLDAEIGQTLLEHDNRLQRWEDFASGRAMFEKYGKKASDIEDPQIWYVVARNIAIGLINAIATLTPDAIVLGGGVGTYLPKFYDRLIEDLKIYELPLLTIPPILQAQRPEEAVIYGAYELAKAHHGTNAS